MKPGVLLTNSISRECDVRIKIEVIDDLDINGFKLQEERWQINYEGGGKNEQNGWWCMKKNVNK